MRRFFSLFVLVMLISVNIFAFDIIITRDSERIEAKIEVVSAYEIHYKKASNLEGPTFVIETSKVASVVYGNGEVQVFNSLENVAKEVKTSQDIMYLENDMLYRYGDLKLTHTEYVWYLMKYCPSAYEQYRAGDKKVSMGQAFLAAGILSDLLGASFVTIGVLGDDSACTLVGSSFLIIGTGFEIACIPVWIKGYRQRAGALDTFNATCAKNNQPKVSMDVKIKSNGVGLAFNF
ncbi:MAG: hypothetical protein IJ776_10565 [Paludibacteraceae bacterium]|nr:hypothetical protein [Paludibacteraceae bacterium]